MRPSLPNPKADEQPPAAAAGVARSRRWIVGLGFGSMLVALVAALLMLPSFILGRVVEEAALRGFRLTGCELDLGLSEIRLRQCSFESIAARDALAPFGGLKLQGVVRELEMRLASLRPERVVIRGISVDARGKPAWGDVIRAEPSGWAPLPVDVEAGALRWLDEGTGAQVSFSDIAYSSDRESLQAAWDWPGRARGQLAWRDGAFDVTQGDGARPTAHLVLRPFRAEQRVELILDLRTFPLRQLEGPALALTDTLRGIEVDGRIFVNVPIGLTTELPAGDVYLTLRGLQFPVPREIDGLVHSTAPKLSGKLSVNRTFDHASFRALGFFTGELQMVGRAELALDDQSRGLHFESHMSGPLSCRAIAESAVSARAGTALGKLAGAFAKRVLSGNVQIVAALSGDTWQLARTQVLTSIGVGCGLRPLPLDASSAVEILSNLPEDVLRQLPSAQELLKLPQLPKAPSLPDNWRLQRLAPPSSGAPETHEGPP